MYFFLDDLVLKKNEWHFLAASFNADTNKNLLVVNEGYGGKNLEKDYFEIDDFNWISKVFTGEQVVIGGMHSDSNDNLKSFDGSISCLQIFDYFLDLAAISMKKYCPDVDKKEQKCPLNYHFFDGICYGVQSSKYSFSQAEAACLPKHDSPYESRLAFTNNLEHLDFISYIAKDSTESISSWIGLADKDEDEILETRYVSSQ